MLINGVAEGRPTSRQIDGRAAELAARQYLEDRGLGFVAANVRLRAGELDLVMLDGDCLVFVEVRYRRSRRYGGAAASVDGRKQRRLLACGALYVQRFPVWRNCRLRFDVVAVQPGVYGGLDCDWLRNAIRG